MALARICAALLMLAGLAHSESAMAWGNVGHRVIADIALYNIAPQTSASLHRLLQADSRLHTPGCPIRNLEDASTWPDCLRGDPAHWRFTSAWHFQNEPVCGHFDVVANCPGAACVSAQIIRMRRILADRHARDEQRLAALAFLAHFIGDIHQPLHVGDNGDRGGNDVVLGNAPLPQTDPGRAENLHGFWDTLPEAALSAGPPLVRVYSSAEKARIATGDVADWGRESYDLARHVAYAQAFRHDPCTGAPPRVVTIGEAQVAADLPLVRGRLVQAGLRLARVLDQALGRG